MVRGENPESGGKSIKKANGEDQLSCSFLTHFSASFRTEDSFSRPQSRMMPRITSRIGVPPVAMETGRAGEMLGS